MISGEAARVKLDEYVHAGVQRAKATLTSVLENVPEVATVRAAHSDAIEPKRLLEEAKKKMGRGTADKIADKYNSPDVEELPPGQTLWRWSNAISAVAKGEDGEIQLDLEKMAGEVLLRAAAPRVTA